jgi:hypothetical protein
MTSEMAVEHLVLVLIVIVSGLFAGLYRIMLAERHRTDGTIMACSRCGGGTALVDDTVEHPRFGSLAIIERFQCSWCGHEQLRILNGAEQLDST